MRKEEADTGRSCRALWPRAQEVEPGEACSLSPSFSRGAVPCSHHVLPPLELLLCLLRTPLSTTPTRPTSASSSGLGSQDSSSVKVPFPGSCPFLCSQSSRHLSKHCCLPPVPLGPTLDCTCKAHALLISVSPTVTQCTRVTEAQPSVEGSGLNSGLYSWTDLVQVQPLPLTA